MAYDILSYNVIAGVLCCPLLSCPVLSYPALSCPARRSLTYVMAAPLLTAAAPLHLTPAPWLTLQQQQQ